MVLPSEQKSKLECQFSKLNNMIKSVIIDDVEKARVALRSDLDDYCPNVQIVGEADDVQSGCDVILQTSPDLVFLDIKMGDGSGFDLLEKLRDSDKKFNVIFTTAYDQYAIKAFKYSALDYLLKPIDPDDLTAAIDKLEHKSSTPLVENQYQFLMEQIKSIQTSKAPQRIALSSTEKIQIVNIKDIIRCEASGNYTYFYTTDGQKIIVSKTMKEYVDILEEQDFVRVHHSHLINMDQVKEFVKIDGTYLLMKNGHEVPVSVRKKEELMKKFSSLN